MVSQKLGAKNAALQTRFFSCHRFLSTESLSGTTHSGLGSPKMENCLNKKGALHKLLTFSKIREQ